MLLLSCWCNVALLSVQYDAANSSTAKPPIVFLFPIISSSFVVFLEHASSKKSSFVLRCLYEIYPLLQDHIITSSTSVFISFPRFYLCSLSRQVCGIDPFSSEILEL